MEFPPVLGRDIQLLASIEEPSGELGTVGRIVAIKKRFLPRGDDEFGDIHVSSRGDLCEYVLEL